MVTGTTRKTAAKVKIARHAEKGAYTYKGNITITDVKPYMAWDGRNGKYADGRTETYFTLENGAIGYYLGEDWADEGAVYNATVRFTQNGWVGRVGNDIRQAARIWIKEL